MTWHASGCSVGPDNLNQVHPIRSTTIVTGQRSVEYRCEVCRATHTVVADRRTDREKR
jgi:hypothetical protein